MDSIFRGCYRSVVSSSLKNTHLLTLTPAIGLRVDQNVIREGVRVIGRDWRDVIAFAIDSLYDFEHGQLQLFLHLPPVPHRLRFAPRRCQCNIYYPILPYCLFIRFRDEPAFLALLFKKLNNKLAAAGFGLVLWRLLRRTRVELTDQSVRALLDE